MSAAKWSLLLTLAALAASVPAGTECEYAKKAKETCADGTYKPAGGDYNFRYVAAAREESGRYKYTRILHNAHDRNLLPAEWKDADLDFVDIAPGECGTNIFSRKFMPEEKDGSKIVFGPRGTKELKVGFVYPGKKVKAPGDDKREGKDGKREEKGKSPLASLPSLQSSITAVIRLDGANAAVNLQVTSAVAKGRVQTTVKIGEVAGKAKVLDPLSVELVGVRETLISAERAKKIAMREFLWHADETKLFIANKKGVQLIYTTDNEVIEKLVKVNIHYKSGGSLTKVGSGLVTLFMPDVEEPKKDSPGKDK